MTEGEWFACKEPEAMVRFLGEEATGRKLRLYLCACCRQLWPLLTDYRSRKAVEVGEEIADRDFDVLDLMHIRDAATAVAERLRNLDIYEWYAAEAARLCAWGQVFETLACNALRVAANAERLQGRASAGESDPRWLVDYLTCIFGNPFRPVVFDAAWRTDTAVLLARQMYESREFSAMPILADALQDAGCDNTDVLSHCRDANAPHVRGCWVVDLVLGKE
jgi:hypothetical protein